MAEYPETSLNSQLIAAGLNPNNPTQTYTDFATQMATNQQNQAMQEQAIARAKELAKQAQLETASKQEADQAGYNSELVNTMTPQEAAAYLKIILKEKGLSIDQAMITEWVNTLPPVVNRQVVEAFASRFAKETTRAGQASMFGDDTIIQVPNGKSAVDLGLTDMKDASGTSIDDKTISDGTATAHVPNAGMYQVLYDNQGVIQKFIPGGKEPVDQSGKIALKAGESAEKQWQKLDAEINRFLKSTRGNQLSTAIIRSNRALNELANSDVLTPQLLSYIQKDLSGIFQGGVPPQAGMEGEDFTTTLQKINGLISKYTGVQGYLHTDLGNQRDYLLNLLARLRESSVTMTKQMIASEAQGYQGIISENPDRWTKMAQDKIDAASAGLSATAQAATDARTMPEAPTNIPGVKTGVGASTKSKVAVPKYTVEP